MESVDDFRLALRHTSLQDLEDRLARLAVEWDLDRASALVLAALGLLALPLARWRGGWIAPAALQALALLRLIGLGPNPLARLLAPIGFRPRAAIDAEIGVAREMRHAPDGGDR